MEMVRQPQDPYLEQEDRRLQELKLEREDAKLIISVL